MPDEKAINRSSAPSAETLAQVNTSSAQTAAETAQAVAAATAKAIFDSLAPFLKDIALTPEKLEALKAPYIDPTKAARERRESQASREQELELRKQIAWRKANCPHLDKNGNASIGLLHNNLDHQVRGICMLCHDIIHPREWVIDAPDPATGKSRQHIQDAHKDYPRVLQLDSMN